MSSIACTAPGTAAATVSESPMTSSTLVHLATDHDGVRRRAAEGDEAGEHGGGVHRVCVQTDSRGQGFVVGLEDVQRARRPAVGEGVDKDQRVASIQQVVGKVHAPDSVVHHPYSRACDVLGDVAHHLGSETIITEEDVADTGYQDLRRDHTSQVHYMRRIFRYRRISGTERAPSTNAPSTTTPAMTVAVTPTACMTCSFHSTVRFHRARSTGSGRTTHAGRRPGRPRGPRRRAGRRRRFRAPR